jgi:D-alanine-D-alanine ligase
MTEPIRSPIVLKPESARRASRSPSPTRLDGIHRVAVLAGGRSGERAISLESGRAVSEALAGAGFEVFRFDPAEADFVDRLLAAHVDCAFNILHGTGGEDGTIQGLLESMRLPYTGSGVLGSALSMDKYRSKLLWQAAGLPTPPGILCPAEGPAEPPFPPPWCVKPADQGSSLGVSRVDEPSGLDAACAQARRYSPHTLVEPWITGGEYTVALVGSLTLPSIRIETSRDFYDYTAKYSDPQTRYHCPSGFDPGREAALGDLARRAASCLDVSGWCRVDFRVTPDLRPFLIEVNTLPGMTGHSLVPMAARAHGWDFPRLCLEILAHRRGGESA